MKFLADENIPQSVVRTIQQLGHDVLEVRQIDLGMPDEKVIELAAREGSIILTGDSDFAELAILQELEVLGIVRVKLEDLNAKKWGRIVGEALGIIDELKGHLTIIEPNRVRRRKIR